jgi:MFS family permease
MTAPKAPSLLAQRAFVQLWFARLCGVAGSQMLMVAVGWQMYDLTHSAWDLGLVGLLQFVPALLLTLPAGHFIDRHHRGRILALCLGTQVTVALWLRASSMPGPVMALIANGRGVSRTQLLCVSVLLGAVRAFQMPSQQALVPSLVPAAMLPRALAASSAGLQGAVITGPALGGLLYAVHAALNYGVCAALFAVAAALCFALRYPHSVADRAPVTLQSLLAGVHFVWGHKVVLGAISLDLFAVLFGGAVALLPMFAKDVLHTGAWGLGLLRSAPAVGALLTSLALTRWSVRRRTGKVLLVAVAVYGAATIGFGLSTAVWLSMLLLAITGAADMVSVVIRSTLVQLETPDAMRGRVSAVNSVFIGASNQLGEFESGASAAVLGPVASVVLGGAATLLMVALWPRWFPGLAQRDALLPIAVQPSPTQPSSTRPSSTPPSTTEPLPINQSPSRRA